jgi:hypothetical protein
MTRTGSENEVRPAVAFAPPGPTTAASTAPDGLKRQPWKAVWPAPRAPTSQLNLFGFEKGEEMVFDGNAGNFFVKSAWCIEAETSTQ